MAEILAGAFVLLLFWITVYRKGLQPRFPKLTPVAFSAGAVVATVVIGLGIWQFTESEDHQCIATEAEILTQRSDMPFVGPSSEEERAANLKKYCAVYYQSCPQQGRQAAEIAKICEGFR